MYTFFEQARMMIQFILLGMFMSIMIDVADFFRTKNKFSSSVVQLLFWFVMSLVVCKVVLVISKGFLPLYTFAFFFVGYLIYRFFLRKRFVHVLAKMKKKLRTSRKKVIAFILPVELTRKSIALLNKLWKKTIKLFLRKSKAEVSVEDDMKAEEQNTLATNS